MIRTLLKNLWKRFLQLNLYKTPLSNKEKIRKELLATRIYVCSFIGFTLLVTTISASIARTASITEYSPSYIDFLRLNNRYGTKLNCPCTKIGIAYNTFITTDVTFHQVCSSQFVEQTWIDMIYSQQQNSSLEFDDFRRVVSFFWQTIAGFCLISKRTWNDTLADFNRSHIFSPTVSPENVIRAQVQATLDNRINSARIRLNRNLLALRKITSGNQMISALSTNFYLQYPFNDSTSLMMASRTINNCSCLNAQGCPHAVVLTTDQNQTIVLPGMITDCLIIDGTLASTLEIYYSQTSISLLHQSLPMTIESLSNTSNKYFQINSTIETILNSIMIDDLQTNTQFDLFYSQCNPAYCTYSYSQRFNRLFVITTLISIFGSLSSILKFMAPIVVSLIFRLKHRNKRHDPITTTYVDRFRHLTKYIQQKIINLNLFERHTLYASNNSSRQRFLTRIFLFLLLILSIAAGFYTYLTVENQIITITKPSLSIYEQLYQNHSDTLQCPCSQLSVPYESFLNVTFVLHQICSSDLILSSWLNYLASFDPVLLPSWTRTTFSRDFRVQGSSYFQLLATFCLIAKNTIDDSRQTFMNTQFINDHILDSSFFTQQSQTIIDSFISNTKNDFQRTVNWIMIAFTVNYILSGTNTNFMITLTDNRTVNFQDQTYFPGVTIISNWIIFPPYSYCSCATNPTSCFILNLLYTNGSNLVEFEQNFNEIPMGCTPLNGLLSSTFTWWYNSTYLENIQWSYSTVIDSQSLPDIQPLNASILTRFDSDQLEYLIQEMFVETSINNETYFDRFYAACAPVSCSYTIVKRGDIIVILFLFISICTGINKILRILLPTMGKSIFLLIDWKRNRNNHNEDNFAITRLKQLFQFIYKSILNLNLYQLTSNNDITLRQQRQQTRVYIILFISSLIILLFYTAMVEQSITKTVVQPSIEDYEQLLSIYSDVYCPCTHLSIPYNDFITELNVSSYYQACSNGVISTIFTIGTTYIPAILTVYERDFRNFQKQFIQGFDKLCSLAQGTVDNSISLFLASTMLVNRMMPRVQFTKEINVTLNHFIENTPIEFIQTLNLIRTSAQGNALLGLFSSNWKIIQDEDHTFYSEPMGYTDTQQNTSCSCATSQRCTMPAQIFIYENTLHYTLEGIILGCYPLETVLLSSLSCFYSLTCIHAYRQAVGIDFIDLEEYHNSTGIPIQLDETITRFSINDTIETIVYNMFIESWQQNISYERFFNSCQPNYCNYKYYYRFGSLELLTTFLSVYAGLSTVIRFIVPLLFILIRKIRNRFRVTPSANNSTQ